MSRKIKIKVRPLNQRTGFEYAALFSFGISKIINHTILLFCTHLTRIIVHSGRFGFGQFGEAGFIANVSTAGAMVLFTGRCDMKKPCELFWITKYYIWIILTIEFRLYVRGDFFMKILLAELRIKNNMSLRALSLKTEISKSTLNNIESGKTSPTMDQMEQLAKALGVKISQLYQSKHDERP